METNKETRLCLEDTVRNPEPPADPSKAKVPPGLNLNPSSEPEGPKLPPGRVNTPEFVNIKQEETDESFYPEPELGTTIKVEHDTDDDVPADLQIVGTINVPETRTKDKCRICLSESYDMPNIFDRCRSKCRTMISTYLWIEVYKGDSLSETICKKCLECLQNIDTLRCKARKSDQALRYMLKLPQQNNELIDLQNHKRKLEELRQIGNEQNLIKRTKTSSEAVPVTTFEHNYSTALTKRVAATESDSNPSVNTLREHNYSSRPQKKISVKTDLMANQSNNNSEKISVKTTQSGPQSNNNVEKISVKTRLRAYQSKKAQKHPLWYKIQDPEAQGGFRLTINRTITSEDTITYSITLADGEESPVCTGVLLEKNFTSLPFDCEFCEEKMTEVESAKQHYYLKHFRYMCQECYTHHDSVAELNTHRKAHNMRCEICQFGVLNYQDLKAHILKVHENIHKLLTDRKKRSQDIISKEEVRTVKPKIIQIKGDKKTELKDREKISKVKVPPTHSNQNKTTTTPEIIQIEDVEVTIPKREKIPRVKAPPNKSNLNKITTPPEIIEIEDEKICSDDKIGKERVSEPKVVVKKKRKKSKWVRKTKQIHPLKKYPCKYCDRVILGLKCYKEHIMSDHSNLFVCMVCLKEFETKKDKDHHEVMQKHDTVCKICDLKFASKVLSMKHNEANHFHNKDLKDIDCTLCEVTLSNTTFLNKHYADVHNKFLCLKCLQVFSNVREVQEHSLKVHKHKSHWCYDCLHCDKVFPSSHILYLHVSLCHDATEKDTILCEQCGQTYPSLTKMRVHMRIHRPKIKKDKKHVCEICQLKFLTSRKLKKHMHTHYGRKNCICEVCKKAFSTKIGLENHIAREHQPDTPKFVCDFCSKSLLTPKLLHCHVQFHHTYDWQYVCNVCSEKFDSEVNVLSHCQSDHTDVSVEPPFYVISPHKCPWCDLYFPNRAKLVDHTYHVHNIQVSTGKRRQKRTVYCKYCNAGFFKASELTKHIRTSAENHGEKYNCDLCSQKFDYKKDIKIHFKNKHFK